MSASSNERSEFIDATPARALAALLDARVPDLDAPLPPLWHWLYLLERPATAELGVDGHPAMGIPTPPAPGMRRMIAGGRITQHAGLRVGSVASRTSRVVAERSTVGRSGPLSFVTVRHDIEQSGRLALSEELDIVYRAAGRADATAAANRSVVVPDPVAEPRTERFYDIGPAMLFRFSALTYNAHRIHYDLQYVTEIERYPGLVVHGPLQALLMSELLRLQGNPAGVLHYQLRSPLFAGPGIRVLAGTSPDGDAAVVYDRDGSVTATAHRMPAATP
ncbi:mesaconyl-C4 CoA hydratase [Jatrophihabitans sp. DSM 45814]